MSIERRQLFATAKKVQNLSSMWRESSSSQNRKAGHTLTHTHTYTHTQDNSYTLATRYGGEGNNNFFKDIVAQILQLLSLLQLLSFALLSQPLRIHLQAHSKNYYDKISILQIAMATLSQEQKISRPSLLNFDSMYKNRPYRR